MARTMSVPCRRDLACYRNDGHAGDHAYATPETRPSPAPIYSAGYAAGKAALAATPAPLDVLDIPPTIAEAYEQGMLAERARHAALVEAAREYVEAVDADLYREGTPEDWWRREAALAALRAALDGEPR